MQEIYKSLLLSAGRALLGAVVPVLRGVAIEITENVITVYFYNRLLA